MQGDGNAGTTDKLHVQHIGYKMNTHILKTSTIQAAKAQAKRLRADLTKAGTPISHSQALELVAHQNDFRDWNTFHAALGNGPKPAGLDDLKIGQTIGGVYLGQKFEGTLIGVQSMSGGARFRVTLDLPKPVDVVQFDSFSSFRKRISGTVNQDGRSSEKT